MMMIMMTMTIHASANRFKRFGEFKSMSNCVYIYIMYVQMWFLFSRGDGVSVGAYVM